MSVTLESQGSSVDGIIPQKVLDQLVEHLSEYGTSPQQWEIVRVSDEGNSALPATHTEGCIEANGGPAPRVGFICRCGATDHAVVTIDVCYDGYHRALFGVDAEGNVSLWAD